MQPTLVLSAPHPGILYINGHFAGEVSADHPLLRPVNRQGALYLDYRPLTNAYQAMARRLVFSGGVPISESLEAAENINIVLWPGSVSEIELEPILQAGSISRFQLDGHSLSLETDSMQLKCDGRSLCSLPDGADLPELKRMPSGCILSGRCRDGSYLVTTDENMQRQTGFLLARQLEIEADGRIRAISAPNDLVGHANLETWRLNHEGLMLLASEPAWINGAPRWPQTAAETARAAVEAALAGLESEAESYLSSTLKRSNPLQNIREKCDLCVEMRYAPPDPRPCVGLLRLESDRLAHVHPLYYRAIPSGGPHGPYLIEEMEFQ